MMHNNAHLGFLVLFNYSSKNFKTSFKTGIPVLEFLNTEKPVLKRDTGFEGPNINICIL
jgi:hypothetical protein